MGENVFGRRVRQLRLEKELSQSELGKLLGYSDRSTIAKIEAGKNTVPTEKLKELSRVLDTTAAYLLGSLEDDLRALGVEIIRTGDTITIKDTLSERSLKMSSLEWRLAEERNDFTGVWEALEGKKKAPANGGLKTQIQELFDQLSPAKQVELLELCNFYLAQQHKNEETP